MLIHISGFRIVILLSRPFSIGYNPSECNGLDRVSDHMLSWPISSHHTWPDYFSITKTFAFQISITAARALFVYPLSFVLNLRRRPRLPRSYQHMLVFAGLRGAMAFALADRNTATDNRQVPLRGFIHAYLFRMHKITVFR